MYPRACEAFYVLVCVEGGEKVDFLAIPNVETGRGREVFQGGGNMGFTVLVRRFLYPLF